MKTTNIRFCFYFYWLRERTFHCFLILPKNWCIFWSSKITKFDFETAVVSTIIKSLQTPLVLTAIFVLICAYGDRYKILVISKKMDKSVC